MTEVRLRRERVEVRLESGLAGSRGAVIGRIVAWAHADESVRTVLLIGSRARAAGSVDVWSDYDIVLVVRRDAALAGRDDWASAFGPVLLLLRERFEYRDRIVPTRLVQYRDGLRIDFMLLPEDLLDGIASLERLPALLDSGYEVLVDKDSIAAAWPAATGRGHVPARPSAAEYRRVVEEFWWESLYVVKHLARGDVLPARYSAECVMRFACLVPMLEWYVQGAGEWSRAVGAYGGGLRSLLVAEERDLLDATFAGAELEQNWRALHAMLDLFGLASRRVGELIGQAYPAALEHDVRELIRRARQAE